MKTYWGLSPSGKLLLELHLHLVVLKKNERGQEGREPILGKMCVEQPLEVPKNLFPERSEDTMNDDGSDLVIQVGWQRVPVVKRVSGTGSNYWIVRSSTIRPASPF